MNIVVSSWPGAGGTSVSLMLTELLGCRYLNVSHVLDLLAGILYKSADDANLIKFEREFGNVWDDIWEKYISWKLGKEDKIVVDGRITGFFVEDEKRIFEIMIIADMTTRLRRFSSSPFYLSEQDNITRLRWLNRLHIDVFNIKQIELNYDIIIDNSTMNLGDELSVILDFMYYENHIDEEQYKKYAHLIAPLKNEVRMNKVSNIKQNLISRKALISPQEVLKEWNENFRSDVERMPEILKLIIKSHQ